MLETMSKPPMLELVVELRFFSPESENLVVGNLEKIVKNHGFNGIENLGIANLPNEIKQRDPNLLYAPWYRITHNKNKHLICFVGPKMFSISWSKDVHLHKDVFFPGWKQNLSSIFLDIISNVLELKNHLDISFDNIKYRTIDAFIEEGGILEKSNLNIKLNAINLLNKDKNTTIIFKETVDELSHIITISNSAQMVSQPTGSQLQGSLIDITTESLLSKDATNMVINEVIQRCHDENKKMFLSILKQDYAEQTLGAKYVK